jgi:hypothetical protein
MFPTKLNHKNKLYYPIQNSLSENELRQLLYKNPYDIFAVVDENVDNQQEPILTTFLVLFSHDFDNTVLLFDVSRQLYSTFTTDIKELASGIIELIDVGRIDRHPIRLYKGNENNETI